MTTKQRPNPTDDYALLDSGDGLKLERFGPHTLIRPAAQAIWRPAHPNLWKTATARFDREDGLKWSGREHLPESWEIETAGIRFKLSSTDFGHLGIFPEQRSHWQWVQDVLRTGNARKPVDDDVLNLFAYSGGATLAAAQTGARVCHLDASRGMVDWARDNARLNGLQDAPIRWIVDDVLGFMRREARRNRRYAGIILDPPSFGRGRKGELFKIQKHLPELLDLCRRLLSPSPRFLLLTCHTNEYTAACLTNVVHQVTQGLLGTVEAGELLLTGAKDVLPLPSGAYARWRS